MIYEEIFREYGGKAWLHSKDPYKSPKPEEILKWLEEALIFTWEAKRSFYPQFTN